MVSKVTLWAGGCANIFTRQKRFSVLDHLRRSRIATGSCLPAAADARTSGPAGSSHQRACCAAPWPAGCGKPSARAPARPREHWEFPAGAARLQAGAAGSPPAFRLRSRSAQLQIPEIPCRSSSRQRTKTGMASGNRVHFRRSVVFADPHSTPRSCRPLQQHGTLRKEHLRGQILGKTRTEP